MVLRLKRLNIYTALEPGLIVGFLIVLFLVNPVIADNVIWFSNKPPPDDKQSAPGGMHGLSSIRGKRGTSSILQWLRYGANPLTSAYISLSDTGNYEFIFYSPAGKESNAQFLTKGKNSILTYPSKEEGYYNGYLIVKQVSNDTLYVNVAKAEMLNHSCRNGHENVQKKVVPHIYPETIPAEIVRKRKLGENFHYFALSGDKIDYQFFLNGKPTENARLSFNTQTGWQKKILTNKNGICTFQILQDYFSSWQEFNNRKVYDYMIFGEITIDEKGNYKGKEYSYVHYRSSLSDGYRPARTMYMSMFWAFVVFMVTIIISVAGIFIYRLNRNKIYKEVRFDEKN